MSEHPGSDCAGGGARERPVFRARSVGLPWVAWAPAMARSSWVLGLCPWCCRAGGCPCPLTRSARGVAAPCPVARAPHAGCCPAGGPGCLPPSWPASAAASRSLSPGGVPGDYAGCAAGVSGRRGRRPDDLAARTRVARGRHWCAHRVPADARDRVRADAIPGPAPDDRPVPPAVAPPPAGGRTRFPIARLPHARATGRRHGSGGRHLRFHRHDQVGPLSRHRRPAARDRPRASAILGDGPCGLGQSGAVSCPTAPLSVWVWACPALGSLGYEGARDPRASPEPSACLAGVARWAASVPLRAAISPHRHLSPLSRFFESYRSSWSPVTESNRRPSPYHGN